MIKFKAPIPVVNGDELRIAVPNGPLVKFYATGTGIVEGFDPSNHEIVWVPGQKGDGHFGAGHIPDDQVDPGPWVKKQCPNCLGHGEIVLFVSKEKCERCGGEGHIFD